MARALVFSLHGIRTRGEWQKLLTQELNSADFVHVPLDYGFFRASRLLWPPSRRRQVLWFREQYTATTRQYPGHEISIVAHSLGSYLVAKSLELYPEMKFRRVIFCGSIVRRDFPWSEVIDKGQVEAVLNERGRRDVWVAIGEWGVQDAGASGVHGFADNGNGRVRERSHLQFRHSDCFYSMNYRENWIPFLLGGEPLAVPSARRAAPNWRFRAALAAAFMLILALATVLSSMRGRSAGAIDHERPRFHQIYIESRIGPVELSHNGRVVATLTAGTPFMTLDVDKGEHILVATGPRGSQRKTIHVDDREARSTWLIE